MTDLTLQDRLPDAFSSIQTLAKSVMGDRALCWQTLPKHSLGNEAPIDLLSSELGAQAVKELLYNIDEGYFA